MAQVKIARINELSKKSKITELSEDEKAEQIALRKEYIGAFRSNLKATLDTVVIVDKDGNRKELRKH